VTEPDASRAGVREYPRMSSRYALPVLTAVVTGAILTPALATGARSPQAHAARLPVLATEFGRPKVRPTTIDYTGDGSGIIGRLPSDEHAASKRPGSLHWTVWTNRRAAGSGTVWLKSCNPDCAASPFYSYPLTLTAGRVRNGHFTRLTLRYRYRGRMVVDRRCVRDRPPDQSYGLLFNGRCG
jgi:hypothetical protein